MDNKSAELFKKGINFHTEGHLAEAIDIYKGLLANGIKDYNLYYLYGMANFAIGNNGEAIAYLKSAIDLKPTEVEPYAALAELQIAEQKYAEAIAVINIAISKGVNDFNLYTLFANALFLSNRFLESASLYERLLLIGGESTLLRFNLALCYAKGDENLKAEENLLQVIDNAKTDPEGFYNLGLIQQKLGKLDEAEQNLVTALSLNRDNSDFAFALGNLYFQMKNYPAAKELFNSSLEINPNNISAYNQLGNLVLLEENDLEGAISVFQKGYELKPEQPEILNNLGYCKLLNNQCDEAINFFNNAIALNNQNYEAHKNKSLALLTKGDYKNGWKEYEYRWMTSEMKKISHGLPEWKGEYTPGMGLYVYNEQGLGDTLQFCRYLQLLSESGIKVVFECQNEIVPLLKNSFPEVSIISESACDEFIKHCKYEIPLLSIPMILNTTLATIPAAIPYLIPEMALVEKWAQKIKEFINDEDVLRVGFCWAGNPNHKNDKNRSAHISWFESMFSIPGVKIVNLQKGKGLEDLRMSKIKNEIYSFGSDFATLNDTAAVLASLDMVVAVDTSVAHLAGAMGVETLLLLSTAQDWRWMLDSTTSPWYNSMTLLRQSERGDWSDVANKVCQLIANKVNNKKNF